MHRRYYWYGVGNRIPTCTPIHKAAPYHLLSLSLSLSLTYTHTKDRLYFGKGRPHTKALTCERTFSVNISCSLDISSTFPSICLTSSTILFISVKSCSFSCTLKLYIQTINQEECCTAGYWWGLIWQLGPKSPLQARTLAEHKFGGLVRDCHAYMYAYHMRLKRIGGL